MLIEDRAEKDNLRAGVWFEATTIKGTKFSVVNLGKLMESASGYENLKAAGLFMGWEAMRLKSDGSLDTDTMYRANAISELVDKIEDL